MWFPRGVHVLYSPQGVMFSKLCSPNQVMRGRRTRSVSALLPVLVIVIIVPDTLPSPTSWSGR